MRIASASWRIVSTCVKSAQPELSASAAHSAELAFRTEEISNRLTVGYAVRLVDMNADNKPDIVVVDTERVMAYRALRMARGDQTPLASFDQDPWVAVARFDERSIPSLVAELEHVRWSTLDLFRSLDAVALLRRGTANGVSFTPRALAYIIAGHERHHVAVLRERYL